MASIDPSAVIAQITSSYLKLPLSQKILFPLIAIGSIWAIVLISEWATRPEYAVLYSDLNPADAAAVIDSLKKQKVKYEIRAGGSTIAVSPPELVHELRLSLAGEGIPRGGTVGFELFDTNSLGTTGFVERLKFIRATQGELERTITSLDAVMSARVHITQPERTVFNRDSAHPTASVMLKIKPGSELKKKQIKGIANLVAGAVEGLRIEDVAIVDEYGNLLSEVLKEDEDALGGDTKRIQFKKELEDLYTKRIETMLSKVLGPGKVIARVSADLDFTFSEREEENFDPGGRVARSVRSVEEGRAGDTEGGIAGVVSNLGLNQQEDVQSNMGASGSTRREQVMNYEVSRTISKISLPRGRLKKLSVAVLVDGIYRKPEGAPEDAKPVFKPLDAETLTRIEDLVKSAVGFDATRGDTVTVESIQFFTPDDDIIEALDTKAKQDFMFNLISKVGPVLFIVLFFLLVVRPLIKFVTTPTEAEVDLSRLLPTGIEELEKELEQERKVTVPSVESVVDIEQLEVLIAENSRIVKENPHQAALLIRYWLNDGRI